MHLCTCVYVCVSMSMYDCMYIYVYVQVCVYAYECMYVFVYVAKIEVLHLRSLTC